MPMGHEKVLSKALKKYPNIINAVKNRHNIYNAQREYIFEQERLGNAFVICPSEPLHAPTLTITTERQAEIYELGYRQGCECIERVKAFLND